MGLRSVAAVPTDVKLDVVWMSSGMGDRDTSCNTIAGSRRRVCGFVVLSVIAADERKYCVRRGSDRCAA